MKLQTFLAAACLSLVAVTAPQASPAMPGAQQAHDTRATLVTPVHGGVYWRHDRPYWNGYPGYTHRRPGYNFYGGFWFPNSAFGIIIAPTPRYRTYRRYEPAPSSEPTYQLTTQHYRWCENRYRSYRRYDNTFQPYNGPRRQCVSPYMYRIR